jgi:hypothetical protein
MSSPIPNGIAAKLVAEDPDDPMQGSGQERKKERMLE